MRHLHTFSSPLTPSAAHRLQVHSFSTRGVALSPPSERRPPSQAALNTGTTSPSSSPSQPHLRRLEGATPSSRPRHAARKDPGQLPGLPDSPCEPSGSVGCCADAVLGVLGLPSLFNPPHRSPTSILSSVSLSLSPTIAFSLFISAHIKPRNLLLSRSAPNLTQHQWPILHRTASTFVWVVNTGWGRRLARALLVRNVLCQYSATAIDSRL